MVQLSEKEEKKIKTLITITYYKNIIGLVLVAIGLIPIVLLLLVSLLSFVLSFFN